MKFETENWVMFNCHQCKYELDFELNNREPFSITCLHDGTIVIRIHPLDV